MNSPVSVKSQGVRPPSERSFGTVFCVIFGLIGMFPIINGMQPLYWALGISGLILVVALFAPRRLRTLNLAWFRFGLFLHRFANPIVMGVIYFLVIVPAGLATRIFRKDPLRLKLDAQLDSYWIKRDPPGPASDSLRNPF